MGQRDQISYPVCLARMLKLRALPRLKLKALPRRNSPFDQRVSGARVIFVYGECLLAPVSITSQLFTISCFRVETVLKAGAVHICPPTSTVHLSCACSRSLF